MWDENLIEEKKVVQKLLNIVNSLQELKCETMTTLPVYNQLKLLCRRCHRRRNPSRHFSLLLV